MSKIKLYRTKFPYMMWYWTNGNENLFELSEEEIYFFVLLVKEAFKSEASAYEK